MQHTLYHHTPIGILEIKEENNCIASVRLLEVSETVPQNGEDNEYSPLLQQAQDQLTEYFTGKRTQFTLPIKYPHGTPFQHSVWNVLRGIPYGETRSYEDIAVAIGNPKAVRAIGQANHNNPILLLVPCHRVINKNGTIGGFGCGVKVKKQLLQLEGIEI